MANSEKRHKPSQSKARAPKAVVGRRSWRWFEAHLAACISSLGRQLHTPFSSLLTYAVVAIALALPTGFLLLLTNAQAVTHGWDSHAQISLFLKSNVKQTQINTLVKRVQDHAAVAGVRYISPTAGLKQFEGQAGFASLLAELPHNPLPPVLEVQAARQLTKPGAVQQLFQQLKALPEVATGSLDMQWVKRLYAIIQLAERIVYGLASLLALGVMLIIGNTIRLTMQNNAEEIKLSQLLGATRGFVRRPLLYAGLWSGLFGGLLAILLVSGLFSLLYDPVARLATLYQSPFLLHSLSFSDMIRVLVVAMGLGLFGSWLAVTRHLMRQH